MAGIIMKDVCYVTFLKYSYIFFCFWCSKYVTLRERVVVSRWCSVRPWPITPVKLAHWFWSIGQFDRSFPSLKSFSPPRWNFLCQPHMNGFTVLLLCLVVLLDLWCNSLGAMNPTCMCRNLYRRWGVLDGATQCIARKYCSRWCIHIQSIRKHYY